MHYCLILVRMEKQRTVIQPPSRFSLNLSEVWQYRELFYFFTWRDIKVKYKQTYIGILWALLQPLGLLFLFTFLFKDKQLQGTNAVRYDVFVLSGLILWNLFSSAVTNASESMLTQANVIKKIYFPRLIIPGAALLVALFDFIIAFVLFLILCAVWQQPVSISAFFFYPAAIALTVVAAFGIAIFLAALNVRFRDFRYLLPFLMQVLFFASGVIYAVPQLTNPWLKALLALNPVNGALELMRYPLYGHLDAGIVTTSTITALVLLLAGVWYFKKGEAYFADLA